MKFKLLISLFFGLAINCFANSKDCVCFIDTIGKSDTLRIKITVNSETRINFNEDLYFYWVDTTLFVKILSENLQVDTIIRVGEDIKQIVRNFQKQILNRKIIQNKNLLHRTIFYYELSLKDLKINYMTNKLFSFVEALNDIGILLRKS